MCVTQDADLTDRSCARTSPLAKYWPSGFMYKYLIHFSTTPPSLQTVYYRSGPCVPQQPPIRDGNCTFGVPGLRHRLPDESPVVCVTQLVLAILTLKTFSNLCRN
ncbi:hypothetical protein CBL_06089 [Carabus blaptoides fortunei]